MIRNLSISAWRARRSHRTFAKGAGAAGLVAAVAVSGAVTLMSGLISEWRAVDEAAIAALPRAPLYKTEKPKLRKPDDVKVLASVATVKNMFTNAGYSLDAVRRGQVDVPRIQHASLPYDLKQMDQAAERKTVFLRFMLPYVLQANKRVKEQRNRMLALKRKLDNGQTLAPEGAKWLDALFEEYRLEPGDFASLLARVDTLPPSLALAQSAVESGWGTSRFAHEGNAPFGQWTTESYGGLVPKQRENGKKHKVRAFHHLTQAVNSYLRNLNTHGAYRKLRKMRSMLRKKGAPIDSIAIAGMLTGYSEEGSSYVKLVRQIIRQNKLRELDSARLGDTVMVFQPGA